MKKKARIKALTIRHHKMTKIKGGKDRKARLAIATGFAAGAYGHVITGFSLAEAERVRTLVARSSGLTVAAEPRSRGSSRRSPTVSGLIRPSCCQRKRSYIGAKRRGRLRKATTSPTALPSGRSGKPTAPVSRQGSSLSKESEAQWAIWLGRFWPWVASRGSHGGGQRQRVTSWTS